MIRILTSRFLLILVIAVSVRTAAADSERWYVLEMQGARAGWLVERERVEDGRIISESSTHLTLPRDTVDVTLPADTRFVETRAGEPVEMVATTDFGGSPTTDRFRWTPDGVLWSRSEGPSKDSRTMPAPEGRWLPPAAADEYLAARLRAGAEEITVRTIDPLNGLDPVTTTRSRFEKVNIELMGRTVEAIRCRSVSSLYPDAEGTEYIDKQGRLLSSEINLGAMTITIIAANEALARAELDPPELMRSVFVTPDRPIDDPYRARRASFVVSATSGTLPDLPVIGTQTVERIDGSSVRVRRDLGARPAGAEPELDRDALTAPTAMLTSEDPRVVELTRQALAAAPADPAQRAERLRRFVHRHIRTKDLSVGFASAAETARTREGDCTEHGVLLAAMLRADGIPSRVVSGLIYADRFAGGEDIFGYHMWAQALLPIPGGDDDPAETGFAWVDLDATLPDTMPMTATHIALSASTLPDAGRINALVDLAPLMGRLAIRVESVE